MAGDSVADHSIGGDCGPADADNEPKELTQVPFTGFWQRWRRRLQPQHQDSAPSLPEAEQQRDAARRHATKELAAIVAAPAPTAKSENSNRSQ
jgi:hypothetical protein